MEKKGRSVCIPTILRFATLFGLSPRMRFDLIVNQFVLEAMQKKKLVIYQKNYNRAFVHIRDIARAILSVIRADTNMVGKQVFNVGSNEGNYSKEAIIQIIQKYIPGITIEYKDLSFGGDMRDISVSFDKIASVLGFQVGTSLEDGIRELTEALASGLLFEPNSSRFRNAQFIVQ
jgi:nucleoside-diphosphate-sugar epimerase